MISNEDLKIITDEISIPFLIATPVYDDSNAVCDFAIQYVNKIVSQVMGNLITVDSNYSDFAQKLSPDVDWINDAKICIQNQENFQATIYSPLFSKWFHIVMHCAAKKFIAITMMDITREKEKEQQIRRQNLRLASLTDELSLSRTSLKTKLENIQTLNQQLQFAAYHDTATNLPNRAKFAADIREALENAERFGTKIGLLLLNIDNMHAINESQGHQAGDEVIRRCAVTLRQQENESVTPYRFSGDDFLLLVRDLKTRDTMVNIGDILLENLNSNGIGVSGGISIYPDDALDSQDLLKFADMAKDEVKHHGKNKINFFHQMMQDKFLSKIRLETKLTKATADSVFQLYFQPQWSVETGKLRGFEALLRWHDEELGWISPDQFIPLAEETTLVIPIGDWVLDTALKTLEEWEKKYSFDGIISVNVSPVQFKQVDFLTKFTRKVSEYKINRAHLEIEITEGILIDNMQETVRKLTNIKDMGIGVSLDDFGTGYSSLRYLQILPLTTLKIDKSFISNITSRTGVEQNITESIINIVSKMGLDTIAEGVETEEQLSILKKINCKNIQGYLRGKPMPVENCQKMLAGDSSAIITNKTE